ncbi:DUF3348 domain-containing protein [Dyella flagellata]|uniref:DUF3348 domain-containing protein n=1 Tax=Dyella flagellata TaxID=1867833 RepID=A0ABQ5X843_9GAMM|nr:DUF3348 domain-containing protein [Dyella flagellata]GLQ87770.1 hypothetical protein GCM10007898_13380 [Dyella flagellata]
MMQTTPRAPLRGPTFIRLLARLTDAVDVPAPGQSVPHRLSHWLDWRQAIALSTALDDKPSEVDSGAPHLDNTVEDACARVRMGLIQAIAGDQALAHGQAKAGSKEKDLGVPIDYTVFRQHYLTLQRRMHTAIGNLRSQLRGVLAQRSAEMARLAEVDAVMEMALSPRELKVMASVPALLGQRFERLRQSRQDSPADAQLSESAWLGVFRKDMQSLLLAELEVRFQPVDGLLAALRAC